jgi:eukaryotic-like serine/threonine-protein kinase
MSANIPNGTLIGNRYEIVKKLSQGGMGEVFLAKDKQTQKLVALKRSIINYAKAKHDFDEEKRTLAKLRHPALPRVSDSISDSANEWMVMDYIEGENLSNISPKEHSINSASIGQNRC